MAKEATAVKPKAKPAAVVETDATHAPPPKEPKPAKPKPPPATAPHSHPPGAIRAGTGASRSWTALPPVTFTGPPLWRASTWESPAGSTHTVHVRTANPGDTSDISDNDKERCPLCAGRLLHSDALCAILTTPLRWPTAPRLETP